MNKPTPATGTQKLVSEIQRARIRVAKAAGSLESAREQSREAKRKRKEAKEAARRARKQVKQAKTDLREAKQVLLAAEEKLARARKRAALATRRAKAAEATTGRAAGSMKQEAPPRLSRHVGTAATSAAGREKQRQAKPGPMVPAVPIQQPAVPGPREPITFSPNAETPPTTTATLADSPAPAPELKSDPSTERL